MARDRRRSVGTLALDVPEGPQGQPAHKAGEEIVVIQRVVVSEVGHVATPVAAPSALLREAAEAHVRRATKLRRQIPGQTRRVRFSQPGFETSVRNDTLMLDFFQEAMAGIMLLRSAVDAWSVELLPDVTWTDDKGKAWDRNAIESNMGTERRLTQVLPSVKGIPNVERVDDERWASLQRLKFLRDKIAHVHNDEIEVTYQGDPSTVIFSMLLDTDLGVLAAAVDSLFETQVESPPTQGR